MLWFVLLLMLLVLMFVLELFIWKLWEFNDKFLFDFSVVDVLIFIDLLLLLLLVI
jgi:hypothetical protein